MPKKKQTKSGSALIFATIILFSLLAITVTLSAITVSDMKMSQKTKSSTGAFFNADSGVEWALYKITNSDSSMKINDLPGITFNPDGSAQCPFGGCNVFFLKDDGTVITQAQDRYVSDIKAVRSVGTQGAETQRAIEAAVAQSTSCWCAPADIKATSATHNGNFGGYQALYNWIQTNGCSGYHVCDQTEISRYAQLHGTSGIPLGFYEVGMGSSASGVNISDCSGWTYSGINNATSWQGTYGYVDSCSSSKPILCCK